MYIRVSKNIPRNTYKGNPVTQTMTGMGGSIILIFLRADMNRLQDLLSMTLTLFMVKGVFMY